MSPTNQQLPEVAQRIIDTQKAIVIAAYLEKLKGDIANSTKNSIDKYQKLWAQYAANRDAHPADSFLEPLPDFKDVIVYDELGFPNTGPGTEFVCPRNVYTPPKIYAAPGPFGTNAFRFDPTAGVVGTVRDPRYAAGNTQVFDQVDNGDGAFWMRIPPPQKAGA